VTIAVAFLAGAGTPRAVTLGLAMFALQASIGTVNDLADRAADASAKPRKPLVEGLVTVEVARAVAVTGLLVGLGLSAANGPAAAAVAVLGSGIGYFYDLRLKGTAWAWLPLALGVPLLPVYGWVGAGAPPPSWFAVLLPAAVAAGVALALGNQLADLADDALAGLDSTVRRLGPRRAWLVMAGLQAGVAAAAAGSLAAFDGRGPGLAVAASGIGVIALGVVGARRGVAALRRFTWEIQAAGVGILAAGWLAALAEDASRAG